MDRFKFFQSDLLDFQIYGYIAVKNNPELYFLLQSPIKTRVEVTEKINTSPEMN